MELILKKDVQNLGFKDDVVTVKNGYGRNFLIPQGFAHLATASAKKVLAENLKQRAHKEAKVVSDAQALAEALKAIEIKIYAKAGGEKLYGSLTMVITLNASGKVIQTEIAQGSGRAILDQRALAIVQGVSPFDSFTADMKRQADQLVVVTRFNFARDETLETRMLAPPPSTIRFGEKVRSTNSKKELKRLPHCL